MTAPRRGKVPFVVLATVLAGGLSLAACGSGSGSGSAVPTAPVSQIKVIAFQSPSLGAFLPAVIKARKLDAKNGLNLEFTYATPDNYNIEFGAGHYNVGASAGVLSEALRTQQGVHVTYLFNLFDYYGTVVTSDPSIKTLGDLKGKTLAAATGTTNYAMFGWFAKQAGLDLKGVHVANQTVPGLSTMALTGRTDATELWEPASSILVTKKPGIRTIGLDYAEWKSAFGTSEMPYLGVAAQLPWAKKNPRLVKALYQTYKDAATWVTAHPKEAAAVIAKTMPGGGNVKIMQQLIVKNNLLRMDVSPASAMSAGMEAVFKAGQQTGYLTKQPPKTLIYNGLK